MKRFAILGVAVLSVMLFAGTSFAFMDYNDNSVDNSVSADATSDVDNTGNFSNNIVFPEQKDLTRSQVDAKGYRGFAESGNVPIPLTISILFTKPQPYFSSKSLNILTISLCRLRLSAIKSCIVFIAICFSVVLVGG